jgi:hypothetical protein
MNPIGYGNYIADNIKNIPYGIPIYTDEIANNLALKFQIDIEKAKGIVNVNLKRILDKNNLERFQKGIYYKARITPFGKTRLNPNYVAINAYANKNGKIIGYETGPSFLNKIGLTSQMTKYKYFATNVFKHNGSRTDENLNVVIRKPATIVNEDNYRYLQLLDAIENKDRTAIDAINPEKIMYNYINKSNLDFTKIIAFARVYYKKEVLLHVGDIAANGII